MSNTSFEHTRLRLDSQTLHIFRGELFMVDLEDFRRFLGDHPMASEAFGAGSGPDGPWEDTAVYTTDDQTAVLFKLTFGGAA